MRFLAPYRTICSLFFSAATSSFIFAQETDLMKDKDSISTEFIVDTLGFRPQDATVTIHKDSRIDRLLDIKTEMDRKGQLSDTYRIQLYYGNNNEANRILKEANEKFPQWNTIIVWESPNFKVWLGKYRSKLEVDRAMREVSKEFPSAFSFSPDN